MSLPGSSRSGSSRRNTVAGHHEFDFLPGLAFEERSLVASLYESIREAIRPSHLPPLELTSKPIAVPDRMSIRTNPWAIGTSTLINGGILALVLLIGIKTAMNHVVKTASGSRINLSDFTLFAPSQAGGGGGGGSNELIDPIQGRNPRLENNPLAPPMIPVIVQPKLAAESAIAVQNIRLPDNLSMLNIGVHSSPNVALASNGQGKYSGIGTGNHGGDGPGDGIGYGPGSDRGIGDHVYSVGGDVSAPVPIVAPEAEFSDEARRQRYQGVCLISLIVDARGNPQNPRVMQALGMGLDEKALEAVRRYRFKPATKDGRPVPVRITVEVDFRMF